MQNQSKTVEIQKGIKPLKSSRPAFGVAAVLTREDGTSEISQVDGGSGYSGQRSPQIHFGLGENRDSKPVSVELRWPGREGQVLKQKMDFEPGWYTVYLGG